MNPFTDFGFKKLFGEETNKRFLDAAEIAQFNSAEPVIVSSTCETLKTPWIRLMLMVKKTW